MLAGHTAKRFEVRLALTQAAAGGLQRVIDDLLQGLSAVIGWLGFGRGSSRFIRIAMICR
jgi:hypothetical protein